MLIFCTAFNQVILNFQISFFNAKSRLLIPKIIPLQQKHDIFGSFVVAEDLHRGIVFCDAYLV